MKGNDQQLESFFKQLKGPFGETFRSFLKELKTDRLDDLSHSSEAVAIYRLQGEIRAIDMFLRLVTEKRG